MEPSKLFTVLPLRGELLSNLDALEYREMTPIQEQTLPLLLAGKDVIGQGKTGSGKTAAFALSILQGLDEKRFELQSLIMCPTRELAEQVAQEIRMLARQIGNIKVLTLCGGTPLGPQRNSLEHGVHIAVGTPGRIADHIEKQTIHLDTIETLVLDEADRMLEMGFAPAIDAIVEELPTKRQSLLFSATFPPQIDKMSRRVLRNPEMVKVDATHDNATIQQHFFKVEDNNQRILAIRLVLMKFTPESAVIFCNTKHEVKDLAKELKRYGFDVQALHGDLEQKDRDQALIRFANQSVSVLVATDVAARGLDIDTIDAVINYHVARDFEVHTHRIGRTGRAGSKGASYSLVSDKEHHKIRQLEEYLEISIVPKALPSKAVLDKAITKASMATLQIDGGKKQKLRPGDIVGALTSPKAKGRPVPGDKVGKIKVIDNHSYVAIHRNHIEDGLERILKGKMKGRSFRVRRI